MHRHALSQYLKSSSADSSLPFEAAVSLGRRSGRMAQMSSQWLPGGLYTWITLGERMDVGRELYRNGHVLGPVVLLQGQALAGVVPYP